MTIIINKYIYTIYILYILKIFQWAFRISQVPSHSSALLRSMDSLRGKVSRSPRAKAPDSSRSNKNISNLTSQYPVFHCFPQNKTGQHPNICWFTQITHIQLKSTIHPYPSGWPLFPGANEVHLRPLRTQHWVNEPRQHVMVQQGLLVESHWDRDTHVSHGQYSLYSWWSSHP